MYKTCKADKTAKVKQAYAKARACEASSSMSNPYRAHHCSYVRLSCWLWCAPWLLTTRKRVEPRKARRSPAEQP